MPQVKCTYKPTIHCDKIWHKLETVDREKRIKFCDRCNKQVFWCSSPDEVQIAIDNKKCIAAHNQTLHEANVFYTSPSRSPGIFIGEVGSTYQCQVIEKNDD